MVLNDVHPGTTFYIRVTPEHYLEATVISTSGKNVAFELHMSGRAGEVSKHKWVQRVASGKYLIKTEMMSLEEAWT